MVGIDELEAHLEASFCEAHALAVINRFILPAVNNECRGLEFHLERVVLHQVFHQSVVKLFDLTVRVVAHLKITGFLPATYTLPGRAVPLLLPGWISVETDP
ncbi:MAG: hypothetical protein KJ064_03735 [Anaerolineae bacterium]|nr:hypothetical protein [Anaerolineae bacterium]